MSYIWKKLLGLLAVTVVGVIVELVQLHFSRIGKAPDFRVNVRPTTDIL